MLEKQLAAHLAHLKERALYRCREVNAAHLISFATNDYLALTTQPLIKKAYEEGVHRYPIGSGGSMVVCGYHPIHRDVEQAFIDALGVDDCLLFSSGYAANLSVVHLLATFDAQVLIDKGIHASIYDGLHGCGIRYNRYIHNDEKDIAKKMNHACAPGVIMTEGIFSMSGQCAPLQSIARLCKQYQYDCIVDEAHAFGVQGPYGLGAVLEQQLTQQEVPLRIIPLGKAFGASGAIVAGASIWIEALLQVARPYIYSTAMSPAYAYGLLKTLPWVMQADAQRATLRQIIAYFRSLVRTSPLQWVNSSTPIQQLQLGCPKLALAYGAHLRSQGILCLPMREPTVSKKATGLRVILNAHHEPQDIDALFSTVHTL